jgi:HlyD family secretion protein
MSALKKIPFLKILVLIAFIGLGVSLSRSLIAGPPTQPRDRDSAKAERVAVAKNGGPDERLTIPVGAVVSGNGIIEPATREVKLAGEVPGLVAAVLVEEGQFVEAGAPLIQLVAEVQQASVAAAEAEVEGARAQLNRAVRGPRSSEVAELSAQSSSSRAAALQAGDLMERNRPLFEQGVVTAEEFDRLKRTSEQAAASADAADARLKTLRAGTRAEDIAASRAQLKAAEARLQSAQVELARRTVRAPSAGELLQIKIRPGEYYQPGGAEPLAILGDTRTLRVRLDVDERDIAKLKPGQRAQIQASAFPGQLFEGRVVLIGRRMGRKNVRTDDPVERVDTKILEVVIELDAPGPLLVGLQVRGYMLDDKLGGASAALP